MPYTRRDRRFTQSCSSVIEALERRTLLSDLQFVWKGGPGDWSDPGGWNHTKATPPENDRTLPNSQDTVTIPSGAGTVTVSGGSAKTINLSAELRFSASGGLNLYGNLNLGAAAWS